MLVAKNLSATRGGKLLFRTLDLACDAGSIIAVQGPSGSGKTTLLRILAGLDDPDEGHVTLEGKDPHQWGWPAYRRALCFVHQQAVMQDETVRENLRYPFTLDLASGDRFDQEEAATLLKAVGLADKMEANAVTLSQGEQQRVALIRALMVHPKVILLDEPTSALDHEAREYVEALILSKVEAGLSAIMVTHDREQAARLCHRVISLETDTSNRGATDG